MNHSGHGEPGDDVLTLSVRRQGDTAQIVLAGELDLHSSERLTNAVAAALETAPRAIELDAGGLRFADSAGLRAMLLARADATERGATLRLTAVSPQLDRLLSMTGLQEVFVSGSA